MKNHESKCLFLLATLNVLTRGGQVLKAAITFGVEIYYCGKFPSFHYLWCFLIILYIKGP